MLFIIFFVFSVFVRTVESQNYTYMREYPPTPFYPDGDGKMLKTPIDSADGPVKCTDPLPSGTYPMARCISNEFAYNLTNLGTVEDINQRSELRSKRRTSHMATWFGHYISFDITSAQNTLKSTPLYIPADDAMYNPPNTIPGELSGIKSLPFNLSYTSPDTPDPQNSVRDGISPVSPFLELNTVYGRSDDELAQLRDGTSCKLLTSYDGKYPPKDGDIYRWGVETKRAGTLFTLAINTVWIREHNRLCDEFKGNDGSLTDQQLFDKAKRFNIALFQKTVSEEYLGTILGQPLPRYEGYNPDLIPGIDTFFATVAFRYGHTELSNVFRIQDEYGDTIAELTLDQIADQSLVETYGLHRVLTSMALQRQEELDIFFSDATRNVKNKEPNIYDLPAFDALRARDRGIPLYNVVREAYGLSRYYTWDEVSENKYIQDKLQLLYPGGPDTAEAFVGAFCEDHLKGSNFGPLLNASIVTQFDRIRRTDKNWWESENFNEEEKKSLRGTTFRTIIARNLEFEGFNSSQIVKSTWTVQPHFEADDENDTEGYEDIGVWSPYSIKYRLSENNIYFKVGFQVAGSEGWFGMGFDPSDNGMKGAEFIIGIVKGDDIDLSYYSAERDGYHPPKKGTQEGLDIKKKEFTSNKATIEFSRPLNPKDRKPIRQGKMKFIMAYNPTSTGFSYHGGNRIMRSIDFYAKQFSSEDKNSQRIKYIIHGIGMFSTWCVLFPISIYIVRFRKHTDNYLKIHRFIQLLGGISISSFGAAAIGTTVSASSSPHSWLGLTIFFAAFVELGLGLLSIWGLATIISINQGYPRLLKRTHRYFGALLLLAAWANVMLGIETYTRKFTYGIVPWAVFYAIWICILIVAFIFGEYQWRKKSSFNKLENMEKEAELDKTNILYNKGHSDDLQEFTWDDINERVQRGAILVVCDGRVVDVRRWIKVHPGGSKILEKAIGTDITDDFHNKHNKTNIVEDLETQETHLLSTYKSFVSLENHEENPSNQKFGIMNRIKDLIRNQPVAKIIDNINAKHFSNTPLAIHEHSSYATKKMLDMVIGRINEKVSVEQVSLPNSPTVGSKRAMTGDARRRDSKYFVDEGNAQRTKFRKYKLTSKSVVNHSKDYPVIKFTFTKVYQDEKDVWDEGFLPGYYIEVQSRIEGQVIIRSYTPIEGKLSKSFSIYVKVYPNGLMSTHLNEQLIGFETQVRGPFDVSDRFQEDRNSLNIQHSLVKPKSSSLINQNNLDGCWEELFMICGGTGITPMLQLIKYHLFNIRRYETVGKRDRKIHMYLLYGNKRIEDVIDYNGLKEYEVSSRGILKISFVFSDPSVKQPGMQGRITSDVIKGWIGNIKGKKIGPTVPILRHPINKELSILPQQSTSTFQPFSQTAVLDSSNDLISSPTKLYHDGEEVYFPQSKIVVCGPMDMIMGVDQVLIEMGYSENDYILLL